MIGIAVCAVKKMKKQPNNEAGTKQVAMTTASQQIEVTVTQPESKKAAAPESLAAILAACGLQHHEKTSKVQGYTLVARYPAQLNEAGRSGCQERPARAQADTRGVPTTDQPAE